MLNKLLALSKAIEAVQHAAERAKHQGYLRPSCQLEEELMGQALEFIEAQMSQVEHPLKELKKHVR